MSNPELLNQSQPSAANLAASQHDAPQLVQSVESLLQSNAEELRGLAEHAQGAVIIDRFIGGLVAQGPVQSATTGEIFSPLDALQTIDNAAKVTQAQGWDVARKFIPRAGGLRDAVGLLMGDARTGSMFGGYDFQRRVKVVDGKPVFTSLDQLAGYLDAKTPSDQVQNAGNWRNTLLKGAHDFANGAIEFPRSETDYLRTIDRLDSQREQQEWTVAAATAKAAGVDMELLAATTRELQARAQKNEYIGHVATAHITDNYDQLFQ